MANGQTALPQAAVDDYWDVSVGEYAKRQALFTAAVAQAYGFPASPPGGITRSTVTNHNYATPAQPAAAPTTPAAPSETTPPSSTSPSPAAGLLSSPLAQGLLLGLGGPALLGAGALLHSSGLFGNSGTPATPPVVAPIQQAVDLGTIGPDGKFIPPAGTTP
jgi:hypothetical protein